MLCQGGLDAIVRAREGEEIKKRYEHREGKETYKYVKKLHAIETTKIETEIKKVFGT